MYYKTLLAHDPIPRLPSKVLPLGWQHFSSNFELDLVIKIFNLTISTYQLHSSINREGFLQIEVMKHMERSYLFEIEEKSMAMFLDYVSIVHRYYRRVIDLYINAGLKFLGHINNKEELLDNTFGILPVVEDKNLDIKSFFIVFVCKCEKLGKELT